MGSPSLVSTAAFEYFDFACYKVLERGYGCADRRIFGMGALGMGALGIGALGIGA